MHQVSAFLSASRKVLMIPVLCLMVSLPLQAQETENVNAWTSEISLHGIACL